MILLFSMKSGDHRRGDKIWFYKTGISGKDSEPTPGKVAGPESWKLRTLTSFVKELNDTNVGLQRDRIGHVDIVTFSDTLYI